MTNVMPPLSDGEYKALKASIEKSGVLVPIEVDEDTGELLDGHHRRKICQELGIEAPKVLRSFDKDSDRKEHALTLNLMRRHLGPISWAESFKKLAEVRGVDMAGTHNRHTPRAATVAALAEEVGVSDRTARYRMQVADELKDEPDLAEQVDRGDMDVGKARRKKREREQLRSVKDQNPVTPEDAASLWCDIRRCAIKDMDIADSSVDAIITDPPYPREYLGLFSDLAYEASRVLKPGGVLVCMSGQAWLPEVYAKLSEHLRYHWTSAYYMPGSTGGVVNRNVSANAWKPLLIYTNGPADIAVGCDVIKSDAPDKETKELNRRWGQSESGFERIIEIFSKPGDLIWDPFLGNGTTAVVCARGGRRFIGNDIDEQAIETTNARLAKLAKEELAA
jgi:site-specific DNA-methyltransferase (adenine-specific)